MAVSDTTVMRQERQLFVPAQKLYAQREASLYTWMSVKVNRLKLSL